MEAMPVSNRVGGAGSGGSIRIEGRNVTNLGSLSAIGGVRVSTIEVVLVAGAVLFSSLEKSLFQVLLT